MLNNYKKCTSDKQAFRETFFFRSLMSEVERWKVEVETLRRKNLELQLQHQPSRIDNTDGNKHLTPRCNLDHQKITDELREK